MVDMNRQKKLLKLKKFLDAVKLKKKLQAVSKKITTQSEVHVRNVLGTTNDLIPEPHKSWIDYWRSHSGDVSELCCYNKVCQSIPQCQPEANIDGAHVIQNGTTTPIYIIPLCKKCNQIPSDTAFPIRKGSIFIKV